MIPTKGQMRSSSLVGEGYVTVRHPETARVDAALKRIAEGVRVTMG